MNTFLITTQTHHYSLQIPCFLMICEVSSLLLKGCALDHSSSSESGLAFICFSRMFSLRQLDDSTLVMLGYWRELDKALRYLACILVELVHKSIVFTSAESIIKSSCALLNFVMFLLVCVLFRLTCELQILRFRGLHKMFHRCGSETVEDVCEDQEAVHRYRFFIIASFVVISSSQFVALLLVFASKNWQEFPQLW